MIPLYSNPIYIGPIYMPISHAAYEMLHLICFIPNALYVKTKNVSFQNNSTPYINQPFSYNVLFLSEVLSAFANEIKGRLVDLS